VRGRSDGESRRWALPAGGLGGLDCSSKGADLGVTCVPVLHLGGSALAVLLACLDDLPLALSYIQASLELLAHGGVLRVEAG
jgi:hypothetical protein